MSKDEDPGLSFLKKKKKNENKRCLGRSKTWRSEKIQKRKKGCEKSEGNSRRRVCRLTPM